MSFDLFISHASEDKENLVRPLAEKLRKERYRVWYDEFELKVGDSLSAKIDYGLRNSKAGLIVLSPFFIQKKWPKRELAGWVTRQLHENAPLFPIWHEVTLADVIEFSPPLADIKALQSSDTMDGIVRELKRAISPSGEDFSQATIEEAVELLERGSLRIASFIAFRALDERLHSMSSMRPSEVEYAEPLSALESLAQREAIQLSDSEGSINLHILQSSISPHTQVSFAPGPTGLDGDEAKSFVFEVKRFLRVNPVSLTTNEE